MPWDVGARRHMLSLSLYRKTSPGERRWARRHRRSLVVPRVFVVRDFPFIVPREVAGCDVIGGISSCRRASQQQARCHFLSSCRGTSPGGRNRRSIPSCRGTSSTGAIGGVSRGVV